MDDVQQERERVPGTIKRNYLEMVITVTSGVCSTLAALENSAKEIPSESVQMKGDVQYVKRKPIRCSLQSWER